MSTPLNNFQAASFRGVPFLFNRELSFEGGRKIVEHQFPLANQDYDEDLGQLNRAFTVVGIITGSNYVQNKNALIQALETKGAGLLIHPTYGRINAISKTFTCVESETSIGEAVFTMNFKQEGTQTFPTVTTDNINLISYKKSNTQALLQADGKANLSVTTPNNYNDLVNKLTTLGSSVQKGLNFIQNDVNAVNSFEQNLVNFQNNIKSYAVNLLNLPADIQGLFTSLQTCITTPVQVFQMAQSLFTYGNNDVPFSVITPERIERQTNRDTINTAVQVNALILAYSAISGDPTVQTADNNSVPGITFQSTSQLQSYSNILENQYQSIINSSFITPDIQVSLADLRNEIRAYFENQDLVTPNIIDITLNSNIPAQILSFQYYGNLDNTQTLLTLNNVQNASFMSGNVEILSNVG